MGTSATLFTSNNNTTIVGGTELFIADGIQDTIIITHNAGFVPSFFSLTTSQPNTVTLLSRTVTFPNSNTMQITFSSPPIIGEDANYSWILFQ